MIFFYPSDREGPPADHAHQCMLQYHDQCRSTKAETGTERTGLALPRHWVLPGYRDGELYLLYFSMFLFNSLVVSLLFFFPILQVVSCLLLFLEEEDVLWMMCALIEDLLPPAYFSSTLLGVQTDQRVLRQLIVQYLPALDRLLQDHDIGQHGK